ncbi:hypothetical protein [Chroococcidiopsis thermalis]|uniref:hypothetical protein n=1 Tax=Chroococcidiopsis thermalis TaxID=54299 RepID=UPI00030326CF|nr:hypothetical protein [Chroococcidiopsis thermalis]
MNLREPGKRAEGAEEVEGAEEAEGTRGTRRTRETRGTILVPPATSHNSIPHHAPRTTHHAPHLNEI